MSAEEPVKVYQPLSIVELVINLARALVDDQSEVSVDAVPDGASTLLRLRVAPGDLGKIIGKQGRTARSIRTILAAASMKAQHRYALDIQQVGAPSGRGVTESPNATD